MRLSRDIEMADFRPKEDSFAQGSVLSMRGASSYSHGSSSNRQDDHGGHPVRRWLDSFRRDPGRHVTPASVMAAARRSDDLPPLARTRSRGHFDLHAANVGTANTLLSRELKGRHLQMIAIGGSIGRLSFYNSPLVAVVKGVTSSVARLTRLVKAPGCL